MLLPFAEWRPDVSDLNANYTRILRNAVPRSDGYGPFKDIAALSQALPSACRGYFGARNSDGTVSIFAGTSNNLYLLDNTTFNWTEVSDGGSDYSALDDGANWVFAQFGSYVIAVQKNVAPQVFDLATPATFEVLAGSPPQAGWCGVVGAFLVLADIQGQPYRIQWSGINDVTQWTSGTARSDFQDLPDYGRVRCVIEMAADVGLIMQEEGARRMIYQPGSAVIFRIDRLPDVPGIRSPYSLVSTLGGAYYWSTRGFGRATADGSYTPLGEERVNRTVLGQLPSSSPSEIRALAFDASRPDNMIGAVDPSSSLILWAYRKDGSDVSYFDAGIIYHTTLNRFSPIDLSLEYLAATARPGVTLEGLDLIGSTAISGTASSGSGSGGGSPIGLLLTITSAGSGSGGEIRLTVASTAGWSTGDYKTIGGVTGTTEANGTWQITVVSSTTIDLIGSTYSNAYVSGGYVAGSIDDLIGSLDSYSLSTLPNVAGFTTANRLGFFTGDTLEAEIVTAEQSLSAKRMLINGMWPVTDAATVFGSVVTRDTLHATSATEGTEGSLNDDGYVPLLDEGRYVRGKLRIPAATVWSFATGIEPDAMPGSQL
jgi:hypothetical protein